MSFLENFHYQITGPSVADSATPKLVFLHGVMGFAANWRRIAKAFESEYQVLVYDQRGHGRSFQPPTGYSPEDYAGDLAKILDELQWQKIYLVGHSMGGRAAYHFATRYHDRIEKLVIEDIGPQMDEKAAGLILQLIDSVPVPFADKREAKAWFDKDFLEIWQHLRTKEGLAAYFYANLIENDAKQAVWRFFEPGIRESIAAGRATERWEEVARLMIPTLVVRGAESRDLSRETYARMLQVNPRIQGVEIQDAGHWVHSDQPDLFIRALQRFFRGEKQVAEPGLVPAQGL